MSNHFHDFLSISELTKILASFIPRNDLFSCILVSRTWNSIFLPFLWSSFSYETDNEWQEAFYDAIKGKVNDMRYLDWFIRVLNKHTHYIKDLTTTSTFLLEVINDNLVSSPNLNSIVIYPDFNKSPYHSKHPGSTFESVSNSIALRCWKFLCNQQRLKSLTVWGGHQYDIFRNSIRDLIINNPESLRSLTELNMNIASNIVRIPPNIERFSGSLPLAAAFSINHNIREIQLDSEVNLTLLVNLLKIFPGLHSLHISWISLGDEIDLTDPGLQVTPSRMRVFKCYCPDGYLYEELASIMKFLPNLFEFVGNFLPDKVSEAIATNCRLIKRITIKTDVEYIQKAERGRDDVLTPLLTSCRDLRVLDAEFIRLDARNIVDQQPWVCSGLEELHCQIKGFVCFHNDEMKTLEEIQRKLSCSIPLERIEQGLLWTWKEARNLKRDVFRKISMMSSLRRLTIHSDSRAGDVGKSFELYKESQYISKRDGSLYIRYGDIDSDALTLRLEDGLDHLANLNRLVYLGFEFMDHKMEKEEIWWIATHLPNLREMKGLLDGAHVGIEPNYKNRELREMMEGLRKDIVHTRRFAPSLDK